MAVQTSALTSLAPAAAVQVGICMTAMPTRRQRGENGRTKLPGVVRGGMGQVTPVNSKNRENCRVPGLVLYSKRLVLTQERIHKDSNNTVIPIRRFEHLQSF